MFRRLKHFSLEFKSLDENLKPKFILNKIEKREPFKVDKYFSRLNCHHNDDDDPKPVTSRSSLPDIQHLKSQSAISLNELASPKKKRRSKWWFDTWEFNVWSRPRNNTKPRRNRQVLKRIKNIETYAPGKKFSPKRPERLTKLLDQLSQTQVKK